MVVENNTVSTLLHYLVCTCNQSLSKRKLLYFMTFYKTSTNRRRRRKKISMFITNKRLKVVLNGFHVRNLSNWSFFHVFFFVHFFPSNRVIVETETIETLNLSPITMKIVQWKALFVFYLTQSGDNKLDLYL